MLGWHEVKSMNVVWLASYPRSGVTFLRRVIEQIYGIPTWSKYARESAFTGVFAADCKWPEDADGSLPVYFVKTHDVVDASLPGPAIHLLRDGRDAIVSHANYRRDIVGDVRSLYTLMDIMVRDADYRLGYWGIHTLAWGARPISHITFDQLIRDPIGTVRAAVDALDLGLTPADDVTPDSFETLHSVRPNFFRSGQSGQWKTEFPPDLQRAFEQKNGAALQWFEELNKHGRGQQEPSAAEQRAEQLSCVA